MYAGLSAVRGLGAVEDSTDELPTKGEVRDGYKYYLRLAPEQPLSQRMSPHDAVEWGRQALTNYARQEGINQDAHFRAKRELVATSNEGRGFNINDPRYKAYSEALGEITGAAGSEYYQVAVELGVLTYDTVRDGNFSQKDAERMGQVTGAIVGGVVAQAFGVPAPIGAMVGGVAGGGTAAIVYNVVAGVDLQKKAKELQAQARREVERFRSDAVWTCRRLERLYWDELDEFYRRFAISWTNAERNIGWRFGLRWFDPNPGLAFRYHWDPSRRDVSDTKRTDTYGLEYACGTQVVVHSGGEERLRSCKYRCPFIYGCPYPNLGRGAVPGQVVEAALTDDVDRVSQVLAARGVLWVPQAQRLNCEQYIEQVPGGNLATNYQQRTQYEARVRASLEKLQAQMWQYTRARTFLQADLVRTMSVVATEKDVYMNKATYLTEGLQNKALQSAVDQSKQLSAVLNNTVLLGGAMLAGYATWRALR